MAELDLGGETIFIDVGKAPEQYQLADEFGHDGLSQPQTPEKIEQETQTETVQQNEECEADGEDLQCNK